MYYGYFLSPPRDQKYLSSCFLSRVHNECGIIQQTRSYASLRLCFVLMIPMDYFFVKTRCPNVFSTAVCCYVIRGELEGPFPCNEPPHGHAHVAADHHNHRHQYGSGSSDWMTMMMTTTILSEYNHRNNNHRHAKTRTHDPSPFRLLPKPHRRHSNVPPIFRPFAANLRCVADILPLKDKEEQWDARIRRHPQPKIHQTYVCENVIGNTEPTKPTVKRQPIPSRIQIFHVTVATTATQNLPHDHIHHCNKRSLLGPFCSHITP